MSEPFLGEIRMFAGNFAPRGWASCDGQLLAVSQNDALFSLLGTIYGGDGRTTFGLPDMRGRVPVHVGTGPGLSPRPIGSKSGAEQVTLTVGQLPSHGHGPVRASADTSGSASPIGRAPGGALSDQYSGEPPDTSMAASSVPNVGGSQAHTNLMPFLCINFIIALLGIFPSRA